MNGVLIKILVAIILIAGLATGVLALMHNNNVEHSPQHVHELKAVSEIAPTCTQAGVAGYYSCSCGKLFADSEGKKEIEAPEALEALGHSFTSYVSNNDATCSADGTSTAKCDRCDETDTKADENSKKGHSFTIYISNGDATCTADGTKTAKCDNCDATDSKMDVGSKKDHDYGEAWYSNASGHWHVCANGCGIKGDETAHTPNIEAATETQAKICTVCKYVIEKALGHVNHIYNVPQHDDTHHWNKCYGCDKTDEKIPHSYNESVITAATCTTAGLKKLSCDCGHSKNEVIPAAGHTAETLAGKAATCTEKGLTDGKKCSVCGETLVAQEEIPMKAHSEELVAGKAATCTQAGLTDGKKCSVCGETLVAQEEIPMKDHSEELVAGKAATCTEKGLTDGKKCSVCGETLVAQEEIPMKDHSEELVAGKAATCTEKGLTDGKKCSVCGETLVAQEEIPMKDHSEELVAGKAATCTQAGLTDGKKCSVCGKTLVAQEEIPMKAHSEELVAGKAATCTQAGLTDGKKCSVCGETLVAQEEIPSLGHSFGNYQSNGNATCIANGTKTSKCDRCDETDTKEDIGSKLEHDYSESWSVDSTGHWYVCANGCGIKGDYAEHTPNVDAATEDTAKICTVCKLVLEEKIPHTTCSFVIPCSDEAYHWNKCYGCDNIDEKITHSYTENIVVEATCLKSGTKKLTCSCGYTKNESIPATGHILEILEGKAATCTATGLTDGKKCSVCGTVTVEQKETPIIAHTEVLVEGKAATCTATGLTDGKKCSVCGTVTVEQKETPIIAHTEVLVEGKAATCTATGLTDGKKCSVCGTVTVEQKETPIIAHTEVLVEGKAATCTATGLTDGKKCSVCGTVTVEQKETPIIAHTEVLVEGKAATCTETGLTDGKKCSVCGTVTVEQEVISAKGHTKVTVPGKAATCTATGLTDGEKCSVCGTVTKEQSVIDALGHTKVVDAAVAPTCTATGLTEGSHCSVCNTVFIAQTVVAATGHNKNITVPGKAATCTATGLTEGKKCSVCGETSVEQVEIPKLSHTEETVPSKAATCTETGLTEGKKCSACGETLVAQESIPAIGHDYGENWISDANGHWHICANGCGIKGDETAHTPNIDSATETESKICTVCNYVIEKALGHTSHNYNVPQHDETHHWNKCYGCDEIDTKVEHTFEESIVTPATCTTPGTKKLSCACGYSKNETIPATNHVGTTVTLEGRDATCAESGLTEGTYCTACKTILVKQEIIPTVSHTAGTPVVENEVASGCVNEGSYDSVVYCSVCDVEMSRTEVKVDANGHRYGNLKVTSATCTEEGYVTITCGNCNESFDSRYDEEAKQYLIDNPYFKLGAKGHTEVTDEAVAPTCTETGLTEGSHCSVCNEVLVAQTVVDALGHTEVTDAAVAPTCTETGLTEGKHCSVCNTVITAQTVVDALGHTVVTDAAAAPTCTATGLTEGSHCSVCKEVLVAQTVVEAKGHRYGNLKVTSATCTEEGYVTITCGNCNESFDSRYDEEAKQYLIDYPYFSLGAKGHTEVTDEAVAPTCTATGLTEGSHCSECGITLVKQETVAALGHTVVTDEAKAPTCTATGLTEGSHCSVCGNVIVTQQVVDALGHTAGAAVVENKKDSTCSAEGSYESVVYCSVCGTEISRTNETIEKKGHTAGAAVVENKKDSTCSAAGSYDSVVYCTVCDAEVSRETVTVDALGHTEVTDAAVAPTCTETGLTAGKHCSVCNTVITAQTVVDALNHDEISHEAKAPTCTEIGWDAYVTCSRCDYTTYVEKTALNHDEISHEAKAPTCTEIGWDAYVTCSRCDYTTYVEKTALNHDEIPHEAKAPTCTEIGWDAYVTCSRCDYTTYVEKTALNHDEISHEAKAPTCTEIGWDAYVTCSRCDYTTYVEKTALNHDEISHEAKAPTCTEIGWDAYVTCSRCDYTTYVEKASLGHTEVTDAAVAATCTTAGKTEGKHCSECNTILVEQTVVEATGHTWDGTYCPTCGARIYSADASAWCVGSDGYGNLTFSDAKITDAVWDPSNKSFGGDEKIYTTTVYSPANTTVTLILNCARNKSKPFYTTTGEDEYVIHYINVNDSADGVEYMLDVQLTEEGWHNYNDYAIATIELIAGNNEISFKTATTVNIKGISFISTEELEIPTDNKYNFFVSGNNPFIAANGGSTTGTAPTNEDDTVYGYYYYGSTKNKTFTFTLNVDKATDVTFILISGSAANRVWGTGVYFSSITLNGKTEGIETDKHNGHTYTNWCDWDNNAVATLSLIEGNNVIKFTMSANCNIAGIAIESPVVVELPDKTIANNDPFEAEGGSFTQTTYKSDDGTTYKTEKINDATKGTYYQQIRGSEFTFVANNNTEAATTASLVLGLAFNKSAGYSSTDIISSIIVSNSNGTTEYDVISSTVKNTSWIASDAVEVKIADVSLASGENTITIIFGDKNVNLAGIYLIATTDITFGSTPTTEQ